MRRNLRDSARVFVALVALGVSAVGCREVPKDCNCVEPVPYEWALSSRAFETKVLVFGPDSNTALSGTAKAWFEELPESERILATVTHDASSFSSETLAAYDVVVFINTNDEGLSDAQRNALLDFVQGGRGVVVVHADDSEREWVRRYKGPRVFVANDESDAKSWSSGRYTSDLLDGIRWATGGGMFTRITLSDTLQNPLAIAVRPDGGVYSIERTGQVRLWDGATGIERSALTLEVDTGYENGLLGLALDPEFTDTGYVYLYASAPRDESTTESGPPGRNVLSRYTANADGSLEPESRTELFVVPSERRCCHEGGQLAFAADGTLLLSTGDNTNPFESQGTAPLDARPGREVFNSRRTAQNPFDPRGKILRFTRDGGVPEGNLFSDPEQGLPEIYVMGVRNPFRIAPDPRVQRLFFGDVGPDAEIDAPRGPRGLDEINLVTAPGNFGWPLCIGQNQAYADFDFVNNAPGPNFDCADKVPALFAYDYATPSIPALGIGYLPDGTLSGRTAIAGAVYALQVPAALRRSALDGRVGARRDRFGCDHGRRGAACCRSDLWR
jgi:glucose/arabinose dehydrogenase